MITLPLPILSTDRCRAVDARAVAAGVPGLTLMHRAGQVVVEGLSARWPWVRSVLVVAGPGNNGGDGYVIARRLRDRGVTVTVVAPMGLPVSGDAHRAYEEFQRAGGTVKNGETLVFDDVQLIVDALLGTGLSRDVAGAALAAIAAMNDSGLPIIAVDTPSGLDTDTGQPRPDSVRATETVSFVASKPGFYLAEGPDRVGRLTLDPIGVPAAAYAGERSVLEPILPDLVRTYLPRRARTAHKGSHGRVVIIGGAPGMPGAVRLAGEAALRAGAGLVTVVTHPGHAAAIAMARPELICLGLDAGGSVRAVLDAADVVAIGPGLGQTAWARDWYAEAVACGKPLIMDADALNLLAAEPTRREGWVLTPHPGEAGRLLRSDAHAVQADRRGSVLGLAERYGATVVLKGARTLIASPGRPQPWVCLDGNPGMATAGMGDVLTGVIAGLAAQQPNPFAALAEIAAVGVQVHASAGDLAAYASAYAGERGLLASDVVTALRAAVNP
jgi:ADP-dependent NAD(P)H-hydrate dehydratase / NAD(P)H-hydrate epimerase